jgi:hypothetical protein
MSTPVQLRQYNRWFLIPPQDPACPLNMWVESASFPLLLEAIDRHSEITSFGKRRLSGNRSARNLRWYHYRNLIRQATSNFRAALEVPNRSACLLYYYAMLNFAKAELLDSNFTAVTGRLYHGLSFDPTRAKTVVGDSLKVHDGAFRMLYEKRTGRSIPLGTLLPVKRLLAHIPEIGTQVSDANLGSTQVGGVLHMVVSDGNRSWPVLAMYAAPDLLGAASKSLLERYFEEVNISYFDWMALQSQFGISSRYTYMPFIYQSKQTVPSTSPTEVNVSGGLQITWKIRDLLGLRTVEQWDAFLAPSLYKQRLLVMPPSLCRYAVTFYASSLVRYRPYMFDSETYSEQAFMFDAIARECAMPMLIDTLSGLEGRDQLFYAPDSMRL